MDVNCGTHRPIGLTNCTLKGLNKEGADEPKHNRTNMLLDERNVELTGHWNQKNKTKKQNKNPNNKETKEGLVAAEPYKVEPAGC